MMSSETSSNARRKRGTVPPPGGRAAGARQARAGHGRPPAQEAGGNAAALGVEPVHLLILGTVAAASAAALIAHESANIVKLQIGADGEPGITVSASAEVGDHVGQVEATVEGDGTTIAFNARYLADVLTNVSADQFALELNGPLSPGVFKPLGDEHYIHVVMPVRTTS